MKKMIILMLCCLLLTSCTAKPVEPSVPVTLTTEVTQAPTIPETTTAVTVPEETATPGATGAPELFLTVFAPNEDATGFIYSSQEIPEYSAQVFCTVLIDAGVLNADVEFNSLTVENGEVKLDVNAAFGQQLMSYGTAGEYMMVGSVVNTLLGLPNADTVFITMDGEILESGHVIYDFPLKFYENY